jgi:hypothetical protein
MHEAGPWWLTLGWLPLLVSFCHSRLCSHLLQHLLLTGSPCSNIWQPLSIIASIAAGGFVGAQLSCLYLAEIKQAVSVPRKNGGTVQEDLNNLLLYWNCFLVSESSGFLSPCHRKCSYFHLCVYRKAPSMTQLDERDNGTYVGRTEPPQQAVTR